MVDSEQDADYIHRYPQKVQDIVPKEKQIYFKCKKKLNKSIVIFSERCGAYSHIRYMVRKSVYRKKRIVKLDIFIVVLQRFVVQTEMKLVNNQRCTYSST